MRISWRAGAVVAMVGLVLQGCAHSNIARYSEGKPELVIEEFFSGTTTAIGTVSNRSGQVIRRFRARAIGSWSEADRTITVEETWYWDDGSVEPRLWRWEKLGDGRWRGFEDDLTGPATGVASGNTVHWKYAMGVDTNDYGRLTVSADDVMHLVDENNIVNLVDMYFFGFYVGQVVLHIQRGDDRRIEPWPPRPEAVGSRRGAPLKVSKM